MYPTIFSSEGRCGVHMSDDMPPAPSVIPKYIAEPMEKQNVGRLEAIIEFANELIEHKQSEDEKRTEEKKEESDHEKHKKELKSRGEDISTNPEDYGAPSSAYITTKYPHDESGYYYWQWREDDKWLNEYITPVVQKYDK